MQKTVSENLDLVLKYRSINLIGDPVSIDSVPVSQWPRYVVLSGAAVNWSDTALKTTPALTAAAAGRDNTFSPDVDIADYITLNLAGIPIRIVQDCYMSIHVDVTGSLPFANGSNYGLILFHNRVNPVDTLAVGTCNVDMSALIPTATATLSADWTGFCKAGDGFEIQYQTDNAGAGTAITRMKITILKAP